MNPDFKQFDLDELKEIALNNANEYIRKYPNTWEQKLSEDKYHTQLVTEINDRKK